MRRRESIVLTFLFLVVAFVLLLLLSKIPIFSPLRSVSERVLNPVQSFFLNAASAPFGIFQNSSLKNLKQENQRLSLKLLEMSKLQEENQALSDQFKTENSQNTNLLPAEIVGMPRFVPGVTLPDQIVLGRGSGDSVKVGQAVIFKNIFLGKIVAVSKSRSLATLVSDKSSTFTASTLETSALGVVRGTGDGEMILDNVLLSDTLKISDLVKTKGDLDNFGIGIPPDLLVGKIVSIDKKASNLFQSAKIKSLLDITRLSTVFIVFP